MQVAKLTADDAAEGDHFALSLDLAHHRFVAGAPFDRYSGEYDGGSAYVFEVPEPSTLVLLFMGVVGLFIFAFCRQGHFVLAFQRR